MGCFLCRNAMPGPIVRYQLVFTNVDVQRKPIKMTPTRDLTLDFLPFSNKVQYFYITFFITHIIHNKYVHTKLCLIKMPVDKTNQIL